MVIQGPFKSFRKKKAFQIILVSLSSPCLVALATLNYIPIKKINLWLLGVRLESTKAPAVVNSTERIK